MRHGVGGTHPKSGLEPWGCSGGIDVIRRTPGMPNGSIFGGRCANRSHDAGSCAMAPSRLHR